MGRMHRKTAAEITRNDVGNEVRRLLVGRPTVAGVIWLLAIAMVVGVSGGYLAYRAMGPASGPEGGSGPDPVAPWRARLLRNPKDVAALLGLAHVQLDQQQLDAAESIYRQVLELDASNTEAITHMGNILQGRGQVDAALERYNQALAISPRYVHALWDKGHLLQRSRKDYAGAIRVWEEFIREVGADSQDGRTAQGFITEARNAMVGASPVEKALGGKTQN